MKISSVRRALRKRIFVSIFLPKTIYKVFFRLDLARIKLVSLSKTIFSIMKDSGLACLKEEFLRLYSDNGDNADMLDGVVFHKKEERTKCVIESFRPRVVLLIQGEKTASFGNQVQQLFKAGDLICGGFEIPEDDHYLEGAPDKPFLSLSFFLDQEISQSMLLKLPSSEAQVKTDPLRSDSASNRLLEAFFRLLQAAQTPLEREILVPLIKREIHFLILSGPLGAFFREIFIPDRPYARILKSIDFIRENFRRQNSIGTLSSISCMSPAVYHRKFKELTNLSPKQFQKVLRLNEAKRLITEFDYSAKNAAIEVGYESPSQFSREFRDFFGHTPTKQTLT